MAKIPIALQLYSVRRDCAENLPATLKAVAKMGYEGVEFAGYYDRTAPELKKMVDDVGLKVVGTHLGLEALLGDALAREVEFNQILDNNKLIVAGISEEMRNTKAACLKSAGVFNDIANKLKPYGMRTGYHNHWTEFVPMEGGELPWDVLFGNTKPEVIMQADNGNALHGGYDINQALAKYPGRAATVHVKEYSKTDPNAIFGEGDIPWKEFFRLCETVGKTEWYIVEHETEVTPPLENVERFLKALKAFGK